MKLAIFSIFSISLLVLFSFEQSISMNNKVIHFSFAIDIGENKINPEKCNKITNKKSFLNFISLTTILFSDAEAIYTIDIWLDEKVKNHDHEIKKALENATSQDFQQISLKNQNNQLKYQCISSVLAIKLKGQENHFQLFVIAHWSSCENYEDMLKQSAADEIKEITNQIGHIKDYKSAQECDNVIQSLQNQNPLIIEIKKFSNENIGKITKLFQAQEDQINNLMMSALKFEDQINNSMMGTLKFEDQINNSMMGTLKFEDDMKIIGQFPELDSQNIIPYESFIEYITSYITDDCIISFAKNYVVNFINIVAPNDYNQQEAINLIFHLVKDMRDDLIMAISNILTNYGNGNSNLIEIFIALTSKYHGILSQFTDETTYINFDELKKFTNDQSLSTENVLEKLDDFLKNTYFVNFNKNPRILSTSYRIAQRYKQFYHQAICMYKHDMQEFLKKQKFLTLIAEHL